VFLVCGSNKLLDYAQCSHLGIHVSDGSGTFNMGHPRLLWVSTSSIKRERRQRILLEGPGLEVMYITIVHFPLVTTINCKIG
jgi:hypothetical protein